MIPCLVVWCEKQIYDCFHLADRLLNLKHTREEFVTHLSDRFSCLAIFHAKCSRNSKVFHSKAPGGVSEFADGFEVKKSKLF
jgi:hypothetical protein